MKPLALRPLTPQEEADLHEVIPTVVRLLVGIYEAEKGGAS